MRVAVTHAKIAVIANAINERNEMSIYLDAAATTKVDSTVLAAMLPYLTDSYYNPSSDYTSAHEVSDAVERSRQMIADYLGVASDEIYFTSGGSESNCWAIQGFVNFNKRHKGEDTVVLTTAIEHRSILDCVINSCGSNGWIMEVDKTGLLSGKTLEKTLLETGLYNFKNILVSVQCANNELGTIQNIKELAEIAHRYGAVFHTDATQFISHIDDEIMSCVDMLTASGHKIGTPKGIGFLYVNKNVRIEPMIYGSQNNHMRGGTENVPYIVGLGKAIHILSNRRKYGYENKRVMNVENARNWFYKGLTEFVDIRCNMIANSLPNILNITFMDERIKTGNLLGLLNGQGVYVSAGSACNAHSSDVSHVLKAIGMSEDEALRTIRISFPYDLDGLSGFVIYQALSVFEKAIDIITKENE